MDPLLMLLALALIGLAGFLVTPAVAALGRRGVYELESYLTEVFAEMFIFTVTPRTVSYVSGVSLVLLILFLDRKSVV